MRQIRNTPRFLFFAPPPLPDCFLSPPGLVHRMEEGALPTIPCSKNAFFLSLCVCVCVFFLTCNTANGVVFSISCRSTQCDQKNTYFILPTLMLIYVMVQFLSFPKNTAQAIINIRFKKNRFGRIWPNDTMTMLVKTYSHSLYCCWSTETEQTSQETSGCLHTCLE